ncbi:MAG: 6-carboxytetrahydropterin synthase, partial [Desulfocapsaceae bacterium]|nr:6-carboxytetrahydropterin synthase [Desulfocapsaceae bacterium]
SRRFSARHFLVGGAWGDENVEHSHGYRMELILEATELDPHGFLVDIVEVEQHMDEVAADLRDSVLNSLDYFQDINPSIEQLATFIHGVFRKRLDHLSLAALTVTIWEDEIAWTSYRAAC